MSYTLGCDVSSWNGKIDFAKMKAAGANFVYVKASQLTPDAMFAEYWAQAKAAGILRGAYHYLDWRQSELTQATLFCEQLKNDPGELPPVCDFESQVAAPDPSITRGKLWNFLQEVEKNTGRVPMIYSGYYYWLQYGANNAGWLKYPFWLAWYALETVVKLPPPWTKWTFWQYSGNGNGPKYGSTGLSLDMDWFNGTIDELRQFANQPVTPPIPTHPAICPTCGQNWPLTPSQPPPTIYPAYKSSNNLNVRATPAATGTFLGYLPAGTTVCVDTEDPSGYVHFQPMALFSKGGWVWKNYLTKI